MNTQKLQEGQHFFELFFNDHVSFKLKALFVVAVGLYFLSPIDFLPEALLGPLGIADDLGVIFAATQLFNRFANRELEQKQEAHIAAMPPEQRSYIHSAQAHSEAAHARAQLAAAEAAEAHQTAQHVLQNPDNVPYDLPYVAQAAPPERPPRVPQQRPPQVIVQPPNVPQVVPPNAPPLPAEAAGEPTDYLHDEAHERFLAEKHRQSDEEFEQLMREREARKGRQDWNFSGNDPFNRS